MKIKFSPSRMDQRLEVSKAADVLIINGQTLDLSDMPNGGVLPADAVDCKWVISEITKANNVISLTLLLPHGPNAPESTRFPEEINVTADGPITLPAYDEEAPANG